MDGIKLAAVVTPSICLSVYRITKGPSTRYLSSLVPNTVKGMVVGTRNLGWVLGPSGDMTDTPDTEAGTAMSK